MLTKISTRFLSCTQPHKLNKILRKCSGIYEPDYLELSKPKFPIYPPLLVRVRGYDYTILESYQSWINKIANAMKFKILMSFAMPSKDSKITKFKKNTTLVEMEYLLKIYERNLKIGNINSISLPIFIRVLEAGLPEGVQLFIDKYTEEHDKQRFMVDEQLEDLKLLYKKRTSS